MSIRKFLMRNGVRLTSKGFEYIVYAIELCKEDESYLRAITTRLYPKIAEQFNDTPTRVERAMRSARKTHAITNGAFIKWCLIEMEEEI
jgi:two-component system response regulator (stage 0 sporulation protein A)